MIIKSAPRTRVYKACETCRQHKVKCNGVLPCQSCIKNSTPCSFRRSARRQLGSSEQVVQTAHRIVDIRPLDSDDFAVQYTMPCNVRQQNDLPYVLGALKINESPSGRGKITRIFGPTSTVTVLNLILDLIAQSNSSHSHGLAVESQKRPHTDVLEYLRQAIATHAPLRPPSLNLSPPGPLDTVLFQVQSLLLERYIATSWKILPFQSPSSLRARLSSLSSQPISQMLDEDKALRSIMFPLLAIGSITTKVMRTSETCLLERYREIKWRHSTWVIS